MLLRAIVNLDPYTFADDLADDLAGPNEKEQRTAEDVLLSAIDNLPDYGLNGFAIRLALAGHRGVPPENEFDFLTEADNVITPPPTIMKTANEDEESGPYQDGPKPIRGVPAKKPKPTMKIAV